MYHFWTILFTKTWDSPLEAITIKAKYREEAIKQWCPDAEDNCERSHYIRDVAHACEHLDKREEEATKSVKVNFDADHRVITYEEI